MKRLFALATLSLLLGFQIVSAEIVSPYVLDEKSQVLFGDSAVITDESGTYQGLENYTYDYVNDYLHLTFTYTHVRFAFSDYPPRLYITANDPRATTTPGERDRSTIYQLMAIPVPPGHETGWYAYDVQFDATGYNVSVLEAGATSTASFHTDVIGLADTDFAALANIYPNGGNAFSMAFTPLPIKEVEPVVLVATTTPLIIVPGIMGSKLEVEGNEKWPSLIEITFSITDSFLDDLGLDSNSQSLNSVGASSLLRDLAGQDFFSGLFSTIELNGYTENTDIFEFPYDWRFDVSNLALKLKEKIDAIKTERGVDKVDLVAHSMGGLLVKKYLKDYGGDSVDKFIDIGTPHTGAPKAFKILNYGDNFGFEKVGLNLLNPNRIKSISQNMPSVYELLPSKSYFDESDPLYKYYVFDDSDESSPYLSFESTKSALGGAGRNAGLVERADTFHEEIDGLDPATYGVTTYNIVGCGTPTIGQFYTFHDDSHTSHNIRFINGDGTVPLKSAEAIAATSTYYVKGVPHALLPSASGVKELVAGLLTATSSPFDISPYSGLATSASGCTIPDGRIVSFHSPMNLDVYDASGNHAGPDANGDIENNISGVSYESLEGEKFAFLPSGTDYMVKGSGTGSGEFTIRIEDVAAGEVVNTQIFGGILVTPTTQTQFTIGTSLPSQIALDTNHDGTYENSYSVSTLASGPLESSGKPRVILLAHAGGSSKSAPAAIPEAVKPTLVVQETPVPLVTSTPRTLALKPRVPQAPQVEEVKEELKPQANVATVSKPFNFTIKTIFHTLWSWFTK